MKVSFLYGDILLANLIALPSFLNALAFEASFIFFLFSVTKVGSKYRDFIWLYLPLSGDGDLYFLYFRTSKVSDS